MTEPTRPPECRNGEDVLRWLIAERDARCAELDRAAQAALAEVERIAMQIGVERAKFLDIDRC